MVSSWSFRRLADLIEHKAAKAGARLAYVHPKRIFRTYLRWGHATRASRPTQTDFRCVRCDYRGLADAVAAMSIAAKAPKVLRPGSLTRPGPIRGR